MFDLIADFNVEKLYIALSAIVAILIWLEAAMLRANQGKIPSSTLFYAIGAINSVWVLVTGAAWYFLEFDSLFMSVPAVYLLYVVAGWVYGARLVRDADEITDPADLVFSGQYLAFFQSFALVFFGLCLGVLFAPEQLARLELGWL